MWHTFRINDQNVVREKYSRHWNGYIRIIYLKNRPFLFLLQNGCPKSLGTLC